jgi:hypothetical protein
LVAVIADIAGTWGHLATHRPIGDTNHGSRTRVYQYVLHPDRLTRLARQAKLAQCRSRMSLAFR